MSVPLTFSACARRRGPEPVRPGYDDIVAEVEHREQVAVEIRQTREPLAAQAVNIARVVPVIDEKRRIVAAPDTERRYDPAAFDELLDPAIPAAASSG
ncbi:MAG: hypothetical protein ACREQZ_16000 [Woeseiaceae bacterium]